MSTLSDLWGGGSIDWGAVQFAMAQKAAAEQAAAQKAAADQLAAQNAAAQQAAQAAQSAAAPPPVAAPPAGAAFDASPFRGVVDAGFSQFTPDFYANQFKSMYEPYRSGVQNQFKTASDYLTSGLAKKGLSDSSQGRGVFQQLEALRDQELTKGQTAAQGFQTSLSDSVGKAKESLYGSIGAGQDNASIGTRTKAEADKIFGSKAPESSLGNDVFGSMIAPYAGAPDPAGPAMSFGAAQGASGLNLAGGGSGPAASAKVIGTPKKKS